MKDKLINALNKYLKVFSDEEERQKIFTDYLNNHTSEELTDWNNFDGHIVASGFVYAKLESKLLVLYHRDLKTYLYPGGHADSNDDSPLATAKREVLEETGLQDINQLKISDDELIPIDIDTHIIGYNERLNLPEHYHFDFRYLFTVEKIENVCVDEEESAEYKWIDIEEFRKANYGSVASKIEKFLKRDN